MLDVSDLIGVSHDVLDCWRTTEEVFKLAGRTIPVFDDIAANETNRISLQFANGMAEAEAGVGPWQKLAAPEILALVVIKNHPVYTAHCGVYLGNGQFIHSLSDAGVMISRITDPRWKKKIKGYYRFR